MALAGKRLARLPSRVWVLCGDSEMAEGSMWEAFEHAAHYELDNLTAIIDVNRLGQRGETMVGWDLDVYVERAHAFGWHAIPIDGHDVDAIDRAYAEALATTRQPTVIVARTIKGKGVQAVEDVNGFHGKPLDDAEDAVAELGGLRDLRIEVAKPEPGEAHRFEAGELELPRYEVGSEVATRKAYGDALAALGSARGDVVVLDGEVSNSTFAETFAKAHPDRFFEMYIAEQQMVAAAVGLQTVGWRPFASTFAAFTSRAYDFVRMAAVSRARFVLSGSHAGVSIGEDGPSQMGLEDIAAFRAVHSSVVLHPCDANQTAKLVAALADVDGIAYLRTLRPATPVLYGPDEEFEIGGSRVLRSSDEDEIALVGAGITVHEALAAADLLAEEGISARVIDLYSIKPLDRETLLAAAEATDGRIVTVEDHWPEGGLGEAVLERARGRGRAAHTSSRSRFASCRARASPRSSSPRPASTPTTSRRPRGGSWPSARRAPLGSGAPDIAVLIASDLRKEFSGDPLFDGVSFTVGRRDRLSLAGPNGSGKTTLLRAIAGETSLQGGKLAFAKGTRIALHDQRPPLEFDLTLREYALSGARDLLEAEAELRRLEEAMSAAPTTR